MIKLLYRGSRTLLRFSRSITFNLNYYIHSWRFQYVCPVCGRKVKAFEELDPVYSENKKRFGNPYTAADFETLNEKHYSCPVCRASDRSRLYALYIAKKYPSPSSGPAVYLLDIAPAASLRKFIVKFQNIKYRSADLYRGGVDDRIDITDMHIYDDETFDAFICSHVLEHVPDDTKALQELFRILRPNGWGILMVPINLVIMSIDEDPLVDDIGERWRRFGQHDHVRVYSKQGFIQRLSDAGFIVKQLGIEFFGETEFRNHGISPKSVLYVVEKPIRQ